MRTFRTSAVALALLLSAGVCFAQEHFYANLTHEQETTRGTLLTSGANPQRRPMSFGIANFVLSADLSKLTMTVTFFNIDITGAQTPNDTNDNLIAAHIHANATVTQGSNAPVVWGFFGTPDNDTAFPSIIPFLNSVGGTIEAVWDASEGNGTNLAAQLENIRTGHSYINLHTNQFTGGEIRGALVPEPSVTLLLGISGFGVLAAWRRRRT